MLSIARCTKLVFIILISLSSQVLAQSIVSIGLLKHDVDVMGSNGEHGTDINIEYAYDFGHKNGFLFNAGHSHNITKQTFTDVTYTGVGYRKIFLQKNYFEFDWGLAHHSNHNNGSCYSNVVSREAIHIGQYISSKISVALYFDHISDAKTCNHNSLDNFGARVSYHI